MNLEENNGAQGEPAHAEDKAHAPAPPPPPPAELAPTGPPPAEHASVEQTATDPLPTHQDEPVLEKEHERLKRHHVAPAMIALEKIDDDDTFRIAPEGDISQLATDLARLGQLFPIDIRLRPPDRFQVICGFRRIAALRFLQRDRVLARLHTELDDEDAVLMALVSAIHARPVEPSDLERIKARFEEEGRLTPSIRSMIEKALSPADSLAPETVGEEEEIEADELANDVTFRLGEINQDLSLLADAFDSLEDAKKDVLLEQLRYSSELVAFLESKR